MSEYFEIYKTNQRQQITRLDDLPMVDRSLVDYEKYNKFIGQSMVKDSMSLMATRGCPFKCAYCHRIWPKKHFVRSAENIFAEIHSYYKMGVKRFAFVDDIFNFDVKNSTRFYHLIIKNRVQVQLFFPNGLRGDVLSKDYIDLMVEAGTINIAFALETGSPRLQKLISRNLDIDKLRENIEYTCKTYPEIILELQTMHGFPTETEDEAMMTLDFIFNLKWLDFPYINVLKIFPHTRMEELAIENGISQEDISRSRDLAYDELPFTLPFDKLFSSMYQAKFLHEYFLLKERLLDVLPYQKKLFTEDELLQKYNSYLPNKLKTLTDLLEMAGIRNGELDGSNCVPEEMYSVPHLNEKIHEYFPAVEPAENAFKVLLLDLSLFFREGRDVVYDVVEPPLGLMYLMSYLKQQKGTQINGKIAKSRIDFENYDELKEMLEEFKPDVIGIRTLTLFKDFFHVTASLIRQWGIKVPLITGGPYATSEYSSILQDWNVDVVVLGEGEITFSQLIDKIMENNGKLPGKEVLKEIDGIVFNLRERAERIKADEIFREGSKKKLSGKKEMEILHRLTIDLEDEC